MNIECIHSRRKDGSVGFNWKAKFGVSVENTNRPFNCRPVLDQIVLLQKLIPIFMTFTHWLEREGNYPYEGDICSIVIDSSDIDENQVFKAGKVIAKLKESYLLKRNEVTNG